MSEIKEAIRNETKFLLFDLFKSISANIVANKESRSKVIGFKGSVKNFSK